MHLSTALAPLPSWLRFRPPSAELAVSTALACFKGTTADLSLAASSAERRPASSSDCTRPSASLCSRLRGGGALAGGVGAAAQARGGTRRASPLTSTSPVSVSVTLSPATAAMRFTMRSRPPMRSPESLKISRSSAGGVKSTISPRSSVRAGSSRGDSFSASTRSPRCSVSAIDADGRA